MRTMRIGMRVVAHGYPSESPDFLAVEQWR